MKDFDLRRTVMPRGYLARCRSCQSAWISTLMMMVTLSAGIVVALAAPFLILSSIAGAICNRAGHRRTAIIAILFGFPIMAATAALTWSGAMTPQLLFILVIVQSIFTAFELPARQSLVPVLIGRRHLTEGMSLNWATFNAAFITGPMLAGLLLVAGGAALTFTAATSTFAWMLFMLVVLVMLRS